MRRSGRRRLAACRGFSLMEVRLRSRRKPAFQDRPSREFPERHVGGSIAVSVSGGNSECRMESLDICGRSPVSAWGFAPVCACLAEVAGGWSSGRSKREIPIPQAEKDGKPLTVSGLRELLFSFSGRNHPSLRPWWHVFWKNLKFIFTENQ